MPFYLSESWATKKLNSLICFPTWLLRTRKKLQIIGEIINTFKDDSGVLQHTEVSFQSPGKKKNTIIFSIILVLTLWFYTQAWKPTLFGCSVPRDLLQNVWVLDKEGKKRKTTEKTVSRSSVNWGIPEKPRETEKSNLKQQL